VSAHLTVVQALAVGFTSGVVLTTAAAERLFTRLRSRSDGRVEQARHVAVCLLGELDTAQAELDAAVARHPAGRRLTSDERYAAAAVPARRLRVVGGGEL
jgi:hypothetical protein